ncbi:serine protease Do [Lachnospiraceae bacterium C7]|nr:serine protease Do [Lachnospiraceae bacterium C7]
MNKDNNLNETKELEVNAVETNASEANATEANASQEVTSDNAENIMPNSSMANAGVTNGNKNIRFDPNYGRNNCGGMNYNQSNGFNSNFGYNPNQGYNNQSQEYNPNPGYNPNSGYNQNLGNNQNLGYNPNSGYNPNLGYNQTQNFNQGQGNGQHSYVFNSQNSYGSFNPNQFNTQKPKKEKKPKKPWTMKRKVVVTVASALVVGLVGSGTVLGIRNANRGSNVLMASKNNVKLGTTKIVGSSSEKADVSEVVENVMPSIVAITNTEDVSYDSLFGRKSEQQQSAGSGIIVKQDDQYIYIATNNHVVENSSELKVQFCDDEIVKAEVKGTDESYDLAVVKVKISDIKEATMKKIKVAKIGDSKKLSVGEQTIAIGNALGYGQSVTTGVVSALGRSAVVQGESGTSGVSTSSNLIQTDAAINPGNSGGALLNEKGEVVGINSIKYTDTSVEGMGYAIPMEDAKPIVDELITREKVDESQQAYLGIAGRDVDSDVASVYGMPEGVYVVKAEEGGSAAQSGIMQGDIITEFEGKKIESMVSLKSKIAYCKAGDKVKIKVARANNGKYEEQEIEVTLGKKNQ